MPLESSYRKEEVIEKNVIGARGKSIIGFELFIVAERVLVK